MEVEQRNGNVRIEGAWLSIWRTWPVLLSILLMMILNCYYPGFKSAQDDNSRSEVVVNHLSVITQLLQKQTEVIEKSAGVVANGNKELKQLVMEVVKQLKNANEQLQSHEEASEELLRVAETAVEKLKAMLNLQTLQHTTNQQVTEKVMNYLKTMLEKSYQTFDTSSFLTSKQQPSSQPTTTTTVTLSTATEGKPIVGMTSLGDELYVLRSSSNVVEVYDINSNKLLRHLNVPDLEGSSDMASCRRWNVLYILDTNDNIIFRVPVEGNEDDISGFYVLGKPNTISVTPTCNLLVTSTEGIVKEYTSTGKFVREIVLQKNIAKPWHTIQVSDGKYAVSHGGAANLVNRICLVDSDGRMFKSFGERRGTQTKQLNFPTHLALLADGSLVVADYHNKRVIVLDNNLEYKRTVASRDDGLFGPLILHYNDASGMLYVADDTLLDSTLVSGRLRVFSIE